ncbi:uncharacterized protein LOC135202111 [Macrobrachium nipponense]|uniref:uncharacterized protein LOC135202111 n=1 Tax=Macrobrachium nipponense TaxID=159736 RepID=UPI0030C8156A
MGSSKKKLWIALSDAEIGKYMGLGVIEKWCPLCIHAGYAGFRSQIWLFREGTGSAAEQLYPPLTNGALRMANSASEKTFTPLKQCVIGSKYNVMAVVSEVVKYPSITRIGKLHMMFGIADQSCPVVDGSIKDILLQVFTANTPEVRNILDLINAGDVVRVRSLMMEKYKDA